MDIDTALQEPSIVNDVVQDDKMQDVEIGESSTNEMDSTESSVASSTQQDDEKQPASCIRRWCSFKLLVGLLLLAFVIFVIVDAATTGYTQDVVTGFLDWIEDNPVAGLFAFVAVYCVATVCFIPGSVLTLGAGFVFSMAFGLGAGVALGTLAVFLGASLGGIASFLLGRYLLQEQVAKLAKKYAVFEALDIALAENGLKIFTLLRLSPVIPFNVINYLGGVSNVSLRDYVISLLAILPGSALYVFLGASAGSLTDSASSGSDPTVTIIIVVVGAVFGILAIWLTTRYARRELNRILEQRRTQEEEEEDESSDNRSQEQDLEAVEDSQA